MLKIIAIGLFLFGATLTMGEEKGCNLPKVVKKMNQALGFPKCSTYLYNIDKILPNSEGVQNNANEIAFYHPTTTENGPLVMIVGGKGADQSGMGYLSTTSEIVDMDDPSRVCNSPVTYPNPVGYPIGGTVNSVPMVCGGYGATNNFEKSCYTFTSTSAITNNHAWTYSHDMITGGYAFASANFIDHLWVTGGVVLSTLQSTQFVTLSGASPGPELPSPRSYHCMVILHNSEVMIIGGSHPNANSVIIYNGNSSTVGSFTEGPDLLFSTSYPERPSCALFYSKKHDSRPVVLVAYNQNAQLYDYTVAASWELTTSPPVTFSSNPALPSVNNDGVIIQKGASFYEFSCDIDECSWTTKPQQLIEGRWEDAIAMYLPSDFPC